MSEVAKIDEFVPVMWFLRLEAKSKEQRRDEATDARARDWYEMERNGLQHSIDLILALDRQRTELLEAIKAHQETYDPSLRDSSPFPEDESLWATAERIEAEAKS